MARARESVRSVAHHRRGHMRPQLGEQRRIDRRSARRTRHERIVRAARRAKRLQYPAGDAALRELAREPHERGGGVNAGCTVVRTSCATPDARTRSRLANAEPPLPAMPVTISYSARGALTSMPTQSTSGSTFASRRGYAPPVCNPTLNPSARTAAIAAGELGLRRGLAAGEHDGIEQAAARAEPVDDRARSRARRRRAPG